MSDSGSRAEMPQQQQPESSYVVSPVPTKELPPALPEVMPPEIERRLSLWLTLGEELNPHTVNLVVRFARALAAKLADAEKKYGYSDGWRSPDWMGECRAHLMDHIAKGDPRDVAAYCAFLWHHGESTAGSACGMDELRSLLMRYVALDARVGNTNNGLYRSAVASLAAIPPPPTEVSKDLLAAAKCAANVLFLLQDEVKALGLRAENVPQMLADAITKANL